MKSIDQVDAEIDRLKVELDVERRLKEHVLRRMGAMEVKMVHLTERIEVAREALAVATDRIEIVERVERGHAGEIERLHELVAPSLSYGAFFP